MVQLCDDKQGLSGLLRLSLERRNLGFKDDRTLGNNQHWIKGKVLVPRPVYFRERAFKRVLKRKYGEYAILQELCQPPCLDGQRMF